MSGALLDGLGLPLAFCFLSHVVLYGFTYYLYADEPLFQYATKSEMIVRHHHIQKRYATIQQCPIQLNVLSVCIEIAFP